MQATVNANTAMILIPVEKTKKFISDYINPYELRRIATRLAPDPRSETDITVNFRTAKTFENS